MSNAIFASNAPLYWAKNIPCIPVPLGTKKGIKGWNHRIDQLPSPKVRAEWLEKYAEQGIGILTGFKVGDSQLIGIDVDDDTYNLFFERVIGTDGPIKRGERGKTFFVLTDKSVKKTSVKPILDVLVRSVCVIPPTLHPGTGQAYVWEGKSLLEYEMSELPFVSQAKLDIILAILKSPHHHILMQGEGTHAAALSLTASLHRYNDDQLVCEILAALFPEDYVQEGDKKNTMSELPMMLRDAREKGLGGSGIGEYVYEAGDIGPIPYGYTENGNYAFLHQQKKTLAIVTPTQLFSEPGLYDLAPMSFFLQWPRRNKDGVAIGIDARGIGDMLLRTSRDVGPFNVSRVRGAGIWHEDGKVVKNLHGPLPSSKYYTYVRFNALPEFNPENVVDAGKLLEWLRLFPWIHIGYAELLLGWVAIAPICGVLEWRPHMFLSGPKQTGKTTLIDGIVNLLEPLVVNVDGSSTEAGVRQLIGADSRPVVMDEFESDHSMQRMRTVIKLARSASSAKGVVARGTPEGRALQFQLSATFMFAAINAIRGSNADQSRIVGLELTTHMNDRAIKAQIDTGRMYLAERKGAWPYQMIELIDDFLEAGRILMAAMPTGELRHSQNMSILIGSAFVVLNKRIPTVQEAEDKVAELSGLLDKLAEAHEEDDAMDCLRHLLCKIPYGAAPIGTLLLEEMGKNGPVRDNEPVQIYELGVVTYKNGFAVANQHPELNRLFEGTPWASGNWGSALKRLPGAEPMKKRPSFNGAAVRCTWLPYTLLEKVQGDLKDDD